MAVLRVLTRILRCRPWQPPRPRLIASDLMRPANQPELDHRRHLDAALRWLCAAQDARSGAQDRGGVSAGWHFGDGWHPSYPETTGYIIETLVAAADRLNRPDLRERASRAIDWELSIQHADGAFPGHHGEPGARPVIFNTGQIMHGMMAGHEHLGRGECLESAVRAARWMARHLAADGCWREFEYRDLPHAYNTRAAWAMIRVGLAAGDGAILDAARRNLEWAASRQTASGWFPDNVFSLAEDPVTHTIAYAIRGLLEAGVLLSEPRYVAAAAKAARAMAARQKGDGSLAAAYADGWAPSANYCCVTGVAQMALCWLRLAQVGQGDHLRDHASRAIAYVKRTQRIDDRFAQIAGAIPGSVPIWGRYARLEFPNWAAKFFADALMMDLWDIPVPSLPGIAYRPRGGGRS